MNISLSDISVYHIFVCKNIGVEEMNLGRFFFQRARNPNRNTN